MTRLALDPDVWKQVRIHAVTKGQTASALVNEVLRKYLADAAKGETKLSDGAPHSARPPQSVVTEVVEAARDVLEGADLDSAPAAFTRLEAAFEAVDAEDPWKTITDVEAAKQVAASIPSVRPVPKPTSRRSRSRSKPASVTDDPDT